MNIKLQYKNKTYDDENYQFTPLIKEVDCNTECFKL